MFGGDKAWQIASLKLVDEKSLANAYSNIARLIMKWTDKWKSLDGLSLANALLFAKFAKLSPRQIFPLYGNAFVPYSSENQVDLVHPP